MTDYDCCAYCGQRFKYGDRLLAHTGGRHVHIECEAGEQNRMPGLDELEPVDLANRAPEEC